jgi:hypothetical protein
VVGDDSSPVHFTTEPLLSFTSQMTNTWGFRQMTLETTPLLVTSLPGAES